MCIQLYKQQQMCQVQQDINIATAPEIPTLTQSPSLETQSTRKAFFGKAFFFKKGGLAPEKFFFEKLSLSFFKKGGLGVELVG